MNISFPSQDFHKTMQRLQSIASLRGASSLAEYHGMTKVIPSKSSCAFVVQGAHIDEYRVDCESATVEGKGVEFLLPAQKLFEISRNIEEDTTISIHIDEAKNNTATITITGQKTCYTLKSGDAQDYPNAQEKEYSATITLLADDLLHLFKNVSFSMAVHDPRNYLNGVFLERSKETLTAVATNGHRLARSSISITDVAKEEASVIIPAEVVSQFERNAGSLAKEAQATLSFGDGQIKLVCQNETLIGRTLAGQFPDYKRVIPSKFSGKAIFDREAMLASLNKASAILIGSNKEQAAKMKLRKTQISIVTETTEGDKADVPLSAEYTGNDAEIGFNISYLLDVFRTLSTEKAVMQIQDNASGVRIIGKDGGDDDYIIMPLRL